MGKKLPEEDFHDPTRPGMTAGPPTETVAPPSRVERAAAPVEPAGKQVERIGAYRILEELGEGGMGVVYLAEQSEPVKRRVALKLMRTTLRGRQAVLRFEAERQALARLSHPNVAQMFEAGTTEEGNPYFAMEPVDGERITRYCDSRKLSIRQRLELFLAVCDGVQHAHQKGILHRDLKPSNVLVTEIDGRPVPKIIDFGVAKAIDQPLVEQTLVTGEQAIGTPVYMSPEALEGGADLDTRSDVYSLGVVLYELLVGVRPFEGDGLMEVLRSLARNAPASPSARWSDLDEGSRVAVARQRGLEDTALKRRLRGDLDWIVMRAMAGDRDQRWWSAFSRPTQRRWTSRSGVSRSMPCRRSSQRRGRATFAS